MDKKRKRAEARRKRTQWFQSLKSECCVDCNKSYHSSVMQFDHLPGYEKIAGVSELFQRGASKKIILEEIKKCDLVCANCHALRTHLRRIESGDVVNFDSLEFD